MQLNPDILDELPALAMPLALTCYARLPPSTQYRVPSTETNYVISVTALCAELAVVTP